MRKAKKESEKEPFLLWYNTMMNLKNGIEKDMPCFRGLVYSITGKGLVLCPGEETLMDIATLYELQSEAKRTQGTLQR